MYTIMCYQYINLYEGGPAISNFQKQGVIFELQLLFMPWATKGARSTTNNSPLQDIQRS